MRGQSFALNKARRQANHLNLDADARTGYGVKIPSSNGDRGGLLEPELEEAFNKAEVGERTSPGRLRTLGGSEGMA